MQIQDVDAEQIQLALDQARRLGVDPTRLLNANGLIASRQRVDQVRTATLRQVIDYLINTPVHRLMAGDPNPTPETYRSALIEKLETLAANLEHKRSST